LSTPPPLGNSAHPLSGWKYHKLDPDNFSTSEKHNVLIFVIAGTVLATREHDKGPDLFFHTLYQLADQGLEFKVSVMGETFSEVPGMDKIIVH